MGFLLFKVIIIFILLNQILYSVDQVIIETPFCNQPNIQRNIITTTWTRDQFEESVKAWLYTGGLYIKSGTCNSFDGFTDKSSYLLNHEVLCIDIDGQNIYLGTNDGIYKSSDNGEHWQESNLLDNHKVNYISANDRANLFFACTDDGIFKSTDTGQNWGGPELSDYDIKCIILVEDNYFIATTNGVYKSTNDGVDWNSCLGYSTNTLFYDSQSDILYAGSSGINQGLRKSTDYGDSWSLILSDRNVTSVLKFYEGGSTPWLIAGTESEGCFLSFNNGAFSNFSDGFPNYPNLDPPVYYQSNTFAIFQNIIYAGTENGLVKRALSDNAWSPCDISMHFITDDKIKMLYVNGNDFWAACYGGSYYGDIIVIDDPPGPTDYSDFIQYNCHGFAWHIIEGGINWGQFPTPQEFCYFKDALRPGLQNNCQGLSEINWDYIPDNSWQEDLWDKVMYSTSHSGINSYISNNSNVTDIEKLRIISKWSYSGPVVEHFLKSQPFGSNDDITFWKCKKKVSNNSANYLTDNKEMIGMQVMSDGPTDIPTNRPIDFIVAPMNNHYINLKHGFHAPSGSTFHAYIDKDCEIPWQDRVFEKKGELIDKNINYLLSNNQKKQNLKLIIFPNPSSESLNIKASLKNNNDRFPINIKFYSFDGKVLKDFDIFHNVEYIISIKDVLSGTYLMVAKVNNKSEKLDEVHHSIIQLIIIRR